MAVTDRQTNGIERLQTGRMRESGTVTSKHSTGRLRGLTGAHDEFLLAATAQNLRRMSKWLMPRTEAALA